MIKNNIKKCFFIFTLLFSSVFTFIPHSKVNADQINPDNTESENTLISSKKISEYVIETQYLSNNDKLRDSLYRDTITLQYDFSDAEFFDEAGNLVNKDEVMKTIVPTLPQISTYGASTSGGTWSHGTGYAVCKGMTVKGTSGAVATLTITYKVDFQNVQKGFDQLNRVYSANVDGLGTWAWTSNGVFRQTETATYSAYGGVKGQWTVTISPLPPSTSTKYLYFRVGNDTFWLDHNF